MASRGIGDVVRALVVVGTKNPSGRRVDQVYPCAGGAGHSFKMILAMFSRVIRDPTLHIQADDGASVEK